MIVLKNIYFLFCFIFISSQVVSAQHFFRVKADFSIKEKMPDGQSKLVVGTVYYDKNVGKVVYDISFPEQKTLILVDTLIITKSLDGTIEKQYSPNTNQFSVFHLCLNGDLTNYGLKKFNYTIGEVTKEEDMVITTWLPPNK